MRSACALLLCSGLVVVPARADLPGREDDPVVFRAAELPLGNPNLVPGGLAAFRWRGAWEQIPVQVDERHTATFDQIYDFRFDGGGVETEDYSDPGTFMGADPDPRLDGNDEVVFMAGEAGERPP